MNQTHQLFAERDRKIIDSSVYDPSLEPRYNALGSYLFWEDEVPWHITPDAISLLGSLSVARAFIYHGFELPDLFNPTTFNNLWQRALPEIPNWPGFQRLELSEKDKALYAECLAEENPFD